MALPKQTWTKNYVVKAILQRGWFFLVQYFYGTLHQRTFQPLLYVPTSSVDLMNWPATPPATRLSGGCLASGA